MAYPRLINPDSASVMLSVRMSPDIVHMLDMLALDDGLTRSGLLRTLIFDGVSRMMEARDGA